MVKRKTNIKKILISLSMFLLTLIMLFATFAVSGIDKVHAENVSASSNVLDDLESDENFNAANYPLVEQFHNLYVLTIAESVNDELFIYVYQPSGDYHNFCASYINMSTGIHDLNFNIYELEYLNHFNVFYKYKVVGFSVSAESERNYEIASIYRPWDEDIDEPSDDGNTISNVAYNVGKLFVFNDVGGETNVSCFETETVEITDKYVGFVRYGDGYTGSPGLGGLSWHAPGTDSHFIAFSTDKDIDNLYEATVYYGTQTFKNIQTKSFGAVLSEEKTWSEIDSPIITNLTYTDVVTVETPVGLSKYSYSFERIQTVDEFINTENREFIYDMGLFTIEEQYKISDEGLENLKDKDWVLRFVETPYIDETTGANMASQFRHLEHTVVSDVTILRLKFDIDGVVYDVGAVDNMQTGDGQPDNDHSVEITSGGWLTDALERILKIIFWVIIAILIIGLVVICWPVISVILKFLMKCIAWILKGIWWLISWPFKKIKERSSK